MEVERVAREDKRVRDEMFNIGADQETPNAPRDYRGETPAPVPGTQMMEMALARATKARREGGGADFEGRIYSIIVRDEHSLRNGLDSQALEIPGIADTLGGELIGQRLGKLDGPVAIREQESVQLGIGGRAHPSIDISADARKDVPCRLLLRSAPYSTRRGRGVLGFD